MFSFTSIPWGILKAILAISASIIISSSARVVQSSSSPIPAIMSHPASVGGLLASFS